MMRLITVALLPDAICYSLFKGKIVSHRKSFLSPEIYNIVISMNV